MPSTPHQPGRKRTVDVARGGTREAPGPTLRGTLTSLGRAPQRDWFGYVLVLPAFALIGLVVLYPVAQGINLSFTNASTLTPGYLYVGLDNFRQDFNDPVFTTALKNSVILTVGAVGSELILGMGLALLLSLRLRGIQFFRSVTMASWVIPVVATVMMWHVMVLPRYGLFNVIADNIGLGQGDGDWFGSLKLAFPLIITMHVWRNAPFFGIALFACMRTIPQDHYEAAAIDGASAFQRFLYITLPGVSYVAMIMVILHVLFTFNNFDFVWISTGGGPINSTMVLPVYVYRLFWQNYQTGVAASVGVVIMAILLVFTIGYVTRVHEIEA